MSDVPFPLRSTVLHSVYDTDTQQDDWGNDVDFWFPAVPKPVYGWGAPVGTEPKVVGHDRVVVEVEVYVPPGFECAPRDRMTLDGVDYDVVGPVESYDHNPFGWNPGGVVNLRGVTG